MVEQLTLNQLVPGSSPGGRTSSAATPCKEMEISTIDAGVAIFRSAVVLVPHRADAIMDSEISLPSVQRQLKMVPGDN